MNYEDSVDMINGVIRDIAAWDLHRMGEHVDEGAIDDWIYEYNLIGTRETFIGLCIEYWNQYLSNDVTLH
tara:strand:- start:198 stop:407 length:210 start_codon:yes stop_codon:yes gene_type:complete